MYKLKTDELKAFFRRAASIKTNTLLPALRFIKVEIIGNIAILSKHNLGAFISHEITLEETPLFNSTFLIEENILKAHTERGGQVISLEVLQGSGRIRIENMEVPSGDVADFPFMPSIGDTPTTQLNAEVLTSISIASALIGEKNKTNYSYVYMQRDHIFCSNIEGMYYKKFEAQLPELTFSKEACNTIGNYPQAQHANIVNYDLFDVGSTIYGFIRPQAQRPAYEHIIKLMQREGGFQIEKAQLANFMELCAISTQSSMHIVSIEAEAGTAKLNFEDPDFAVTNKEQHVVTQLTPFVKSNFVVELFLSVLGVLPYTNVSLTQVPVANGNACLLYTTEDTGYIGLIAETTIIK